MTRMDEAKIIEDFLQTRVALSGRQLDAVWLACMAYLVACGIEALPKDGG